MVATMTDRVDRTDAMHLPLMLSPWLPVLCPSCHVRGNDVRGEGAGIRQRCRGCGLWHIADVKDGQVVVVLEKQRDKARG